MPAAQAAILAARPGLPAVAGLACRTSTRAASAAPKGTMMAASCAASSEALVNM